MQQNKIMEFVNSTEFYRDSNISEDYFSNVIVEKELLSKDNLQHENSRLLSDSRKYTNMNLLSVARTSGSTGQVVEVYWDQDDLMKSNLCLWRLRKKYYGILPSSKYISFHSIVYNGSKPMVPKNIMYFEGGKQLSFSKYHLKDTDLFQYVECMNQFQPEWMFIQPSIASRLLEFCTNNRVELPKTLKYIELTGELVTRKFEEQLRDAFKINIANMYGSNEVNGIAYECPCGNMHLLTDNVLVQLCRIQQDEKGLEGDVIVSSLHNSKFPILGYSLGDRVHINFKAKCKCKNQAPIIDIIKGRTVDIQTYKEGKELNTFLFTYCVERVNSLLGNPIQQFKVILEDNNTVCVKFRLASEFSGWKETIQEEFWKECKNVLDLEKDVIIVEFVEDFIPLSKSGKYKIIERRTNNGRKTIY